MVTWTMFHWSHVHGSHNFMVMALGSCVKWSLGLVYTMDQEVVPWRRKERRLAVELVLRSFWFTQRKKWQSDSEGQGPQKTNFKA